MTSTDEQLASAIELIRQGKKQEGAKILANLLTLNPGLELAWLWLADCSESRDRKIHCLKKAVEINPNRGGTRKALSDLMYGSQPMPPIVAEEPFNVSPTIAPHIPVKTNPISLNVLGSPVSFSNTEPTTTKQKRSSVAPKPSIHLQEPENSYISTNLASENIQKVADDNERGEATKRNAAVSSKQRARKHRTKKDQRAVRSSKKIETKKKKPIEYAERGSYGQQIEYIPPKRISVKAGENLYADVNWQYPKYYLNNTGMYGTTLYLEDIRITSFNMPRCLKLGRFPAVENCDLCTFFAPPDCIIRSDPEFMHELRFFFTSRRRSLKKTHQRRNAKIRALMIELKTHGRPVHYSVLAKMVKKRHPALRMTEAAVLKTMTNHPEIFEGVDRGIYQYKSSKR